MADKDAPLIEQIYDQVNEVLGGNNKKQLFTMMFPGTLLNQDDFTPGVSADTNIELRCSNLVNSLLDVCQVTGGHNGRTLPEQYRAALDNLLPKLNPVVEKKRHALREALKVTDEYTLPSGTKQTMTKLDWFHMLVERYDKALGDWSNLQTTHRETVAKDPALTNAMQREDAFNKWFADQAPPALADIQQAHVQVTTVFSSDEESLINSLLDGGDGAITRQKQTLETSANHYPKGTSYPAMFTPSDWHTLLKSDFGYIDMLKSPEAIALKIKNTKGMLDTAISQLDSINTHITDAAIQKSFTDLKQAQSDYAAAQTGLLDTYTDNAATAAKIYLSKKKPTDAADDPSTQGGAIKDLTAELEGGTSKNPGKSSDIGKFVKDANNKNVPDPKTGEPTQKGLDDKDVQAIADGQKKMIEAQQKMQTSGQAVASAALDLIGKQSQFMNLKPYYERIQKATADLIDLEDQLATASRTSGNTVAQIFPNAASERFSQIQIMFNSDSASKTSTLATSYDETSWSVDLFFGSASGTKSTSSSTFQSSVMEQKKDFQIGFLAAKVEIDRDWFDPGVLGRTGDMHSIGSTRISTGPLTDDDFKKMTPGQPNPTDDTILPAFPTAFVIAKDITIQLTTQSGSTNTARSILDKHESEGGGFVCFSVSHNSASHQDNQSFSTHVQGNSVIIRLASPQIIGWYQEFVPADKSQPMTDDDDGFGSFLSAYKAVSSNPPILLPAK